MAQHFLLSRQAETLTLAHVFRMSDEEAEATFKRIRWADNNSEPYCPRCGCTTPTSPASCGSAKPARTSSASRAEPSSHYRLAIAILCNGAKGISALQLSRDLDVQYRTAFVLAHKLREAMASEIQGTQLAGTVEVDGAYFGGHIRPANKKEDRLDRRLAKHQTGKRRVARERKGRTITTVTKSEADGVSFVATSGCTRFRTSC